MRPAVAPRRPTHSDTDQTQNAPVWRSGRLSSHGHSRQDKTVLSVSCLACRCELAFSGLWTFRTCDYKTCSTRGAYCFIKAAATVAVQSDYILILSYSRWQHDRGQGFSKVEVVLSLVANYESVRRIRRNQFADVRLCLLFRFRFGFRFSFRSKCGV